MVLPVSSVVYKWWGSTVPKRSVAGVDDSRPVRGVQGRRCPRIVRQPCQDTTVHGLLSSSPLGLAVAFRRLRAPLPYARTPEGNQSPWQRQMKSSWVCRDDLHRELSDYDYEYE